MKKKPSESEPNGFRMLLHQWSTNGIQWSTAGGAAVGGTGATLGTREVLIDKSSFAVEIVQHVRVVAAEDVFVGLLDVLLELVALHLHANR